MTQQSHFWADIQKNWKQGLKEIFAYLNLKVALLTTAKK